MSVYFKACLFKIRQNFIIFADESAKTEKLNSVSGPDPFSPTKIVKKKHILTFGAMKVSLYCYLLITLCMPAMLCGQDDSSSRQAKVGKIVIDPGHGGRDPGTCFKNIQEKDINLKVALKLGELIRKNYPEVEVIYTRSTDKEVELGTRGDIANKAGADLFLSIHVNATDQGASANGTQTFVMGNDKSNKNLEVAMKENDVVSYEEDYTTKYQGYIPGSPESYIIFSLMQFAYMDQSMMFAEAIQRHYTQNTPMKDRGASHGPFLVLWRTAMPSVLTEMGFITNEKDRKYITSDAGQNVLAKSLFNAFSEYKSKVEGRANVILLKEDGEATGSGAEGASSGKSTVGKEIRFYVQLCTLSSRTDPKSNRFKSFRGKVIEKKASAGGYKYFVGGVASYDEAVRLQAQARKDFKDAFVVAFEGDEQIPVAEARRKQQASKR